MTLKSEIPELASVQELPPLVEIKIPDPKAPAKAVWSELKPGEKDNEFTAVSVIPAVTWTQFAPALVDLKMPFAVLPSNSVESAA